MNNDNEYFRGDTFIFPFELQNENKELIKFEADDILKCGVKESIYNDDYVLYKEIVIEKEINEIQIEFNPEETQKIKATKYIVELELTRGKNVNTIYQGEIEVKGDVVNNVSKINSNT